MYADIEQPRPLVTRVLIPSFGVTAGRWARWGITLAVLLTPVAALVLVLSGVVASAFTWTNVILAVVLYIVIAHAITIGFHRLFTHKSFEAKRPLKIALAVVGSMALEGSLISWVADHRRHHRFVEEDGDPHSPLRPEGQRFGKLRGLYHAHMGWFFDQVPSPREKYAPDLLADRDLVLIDRLFVPLSVLTFVGPFAIGYAVTGRFSGGLAAFLFAGLIRVGFFHHITWSTNSLCHVFGKRPFRTTDQSTNFAPLAALSMGESWHNAHHAFPYLARHGVDRGQLDTSAMMIRLFERLGWATKVRWPEPARLAVRRVT